MSQTNILQQAKQGNLTAIARVFNYLFQDQKIIVKVIQQNNCLRIILTGTEIPEQQSSMTLIHQTMIKLELANIHQVIVYGQQINQTAIAWEQSLDFSHILPTITHQQPTDPPQTLLGNFQWTAWFPYPGSWVRTLLLAAIAFPTISLIIWVFPAIILGTVTQNLLLISIFTLTGIILPSIFLAGIYQIAFFQWQNQEWFKKYCQWWNKSYSLWEGFYGVFVFSLSSLIIFTIVWGLAFIYCQSYYQYQLTDYINQCSQSSLLETIRAIIYLFQNPYSYYRYRSFYYGYYYNYQLSASLLFGIWVIIAAYLYQIEYLIRTKVTGNQIKKIIILLILTLGISQIINFAWGGDKKAKKPTVEGK